MGFALYKLVSATANPNQGVRYLAANERSARAVPSSREIATSLLDGAALGINLKAKKQYQH